MARRKNEIETEFVQAAPDELDLLLSALPSDDAKVKLYRVKTQGTPAYIAEFSPRDFSEEAIRNTYGGGKYKYVAINGGEVVKQGLIEIDGEPKDSKPVYKKYMRTSKGVQLVFSSPEEADMIFDSVTGQPLSPQSPVANKNGNDPSMIFLLDEIRKLREEIKRPEVQPRSTKDMVAELLMYKELFSQPAKEPTADMSKMVVELIQKGMEVASVADGGGSPWMLILDKVLPTVQQALGTFALAQQRANNRAIAERSNGATTTVQPPMNQPPNIPLTGFDSIADKLRAYLPTFLQAASNGTDPDVLVDLTLPQIPETDKQTVIGWLESSTWFDDLLKLHPMIEAQRGWWLTFHNGLLESLKNPEASIIEEGE